MGIMKFQKGENRIELTLHMIDGKHHNAVLIQPPGIPGGWSTLQTLHSPSQLNRI